MTRKGRFEEVQEEQREDRRRWVQKEKQCACAPGAQQSADILVRVLGMKGGRMCITARIRHERVDPEPTWRSDADGEEDYYCSSLLCQLDRYRAHDVAWSAVVRLGRARRPFRSETGRETATHLGRACVEVHGGPRWSQSLLSLSLARCDDDHP